MTMTYRVVEEKKKIVYVTQTGVLASMPIFDPHQKNAMLGKLEDAGYTENNELVCAQGEQMTTFIVLLILFVAVGPTVDFVADKIQKKLTPKNGKQEDNE